MCLDQGFSARGKTTPNIAFVDPEKTNVTVWSFEAEGSLRWMVHCPRSL